MAAVLLVSVVVVNLITIAADLQAGAAGIGLLAGVGSRWLVVPLGAALAGLLLAGRYAQVVTVLRYRGLSERVGRARGFYAILVTSIGLALAVTLAGIPVIGMLVAASVIGGFGTPIGLVILVRLARDPRVMGPRPISRRLAIAGWAVAVIVGGFGLLAILGTALGTL